VKFMAHGGDRPAAMHALFPAPNLGRPNRIANLLLQRNRE
jgi:hypothetical protein